MLCVILYHLHDLKHIKNTRGGVIPLVKLRGETCNYNESSTPPWVSFKFFELCN